jgi:peptide/nickel transport system substrate-binding protein
MPVNNNPTIKGATHVMSKKLIISAATVAALSTALSACGSSSSKGGGTGAGNSASGYNAAASTIVNQSTKTGGTLKLATASDADSFDGGDSYYAWTQNFMTFYTRPLTTFERKPGAAGNTVVGDLATNTGDVSSDGLTWTFHLRPGIKYEDGTAVKSADVKYALERSNWGQDTLKNGPNYLSSGLVEDTTKYKGPFLDPNPADGVSGLTTPDDSTLVIKLLHPFSDLSQVLTFPGSSPVPRAKDTGSQYKLHPLSVGPYQFDANYVPGKSVALKKNPAWDASTDPGKLHPQLLDGVQVQIGLDQNDLDQQLLAGSIDMDLQGSGVGSAAQTQILQDAAGKKQQADSALTGREWYAQFNTATGPFSDIHCRKAVEWLLDKTPLQNAYGGPVTGDVASTLMPPNMAGYKQFNLYPSANGDNKGNLAKAQAEMAQCATPNGFNTVITARTERQHEIDAATSIKSQLAQLKINADVQTHPTKQYFTNYAGAPAWVNANNVGIMMGGWQPDWNDGYGMMEQVITKDGIHAQGGGTNLSQYSDPAIEAQFATAATTTDPAARNAIWGQIDQKNLDDATIVPIVYVKTLSWRPKQLTNVYLWQAYGIYDLSQIGLSR